MTATQPNQQRFCILTNLVTYFRWCVTRCVWRDCCSCQFHMRMVSVDEYEFAFVFCCFHTWLIHCETIVVVSTFTVLSDMHNDLGVFQTKIVVGNDQLLDYQALQLLSASEQHSQVLALSRQLQQIAQYVVSIFVCLYCNASSICQSLMKQTY